MTELKLSKDPNTKTVELYIQLLIVNIIISSLIYMIAPEKIPGNYHNGVFSNYRDKIKIFIPLIMQLLFIPMSFVFGAMLYFKMKLQGKTLEKWQRNALTFLTGVDVKDEKLESVAQKMINIILLSICTILPIVSLASLGFIYEIQSMGGLMVLVFGGLVISMFPIAMAIGRRIR